jgi:hypothetical protein
MWRQELLNNKWTNINKETALRKLLTGSKGRALRNLGTLEYNIKRKWENQLTKKKINWSWKENTN